MYTDYGWTDIRIDYRRASLLKTERRSPYSLFFLSRHGRFDQMLTNQALKRIIREPKSSETRAAEPKRKAVLTF